MENFTQEEIESAKRIWDSWHNCTEWGGMVGFPQYLETLSKPKRKHLIIDVEYTDIEKYPSINIALIKESIKDFFQPEYNFEVTDYLSR